MIELKTLKDLESNDESVDLLMKVRAEAVKWVKDYRKYKEVFLPFDLAMMEFMDLEEEDLK